MKPLPKGWVPIRVYWKDRAPIVDWAYVGDTKFIDPFFGQTINYALRNPSSLLFRHQTGFQFLEEQTAESPGLEPSGFIFHMSRCGSTLISQMLAAVPRHLVISEAPPIDGVLRSQSGDPAITDEQRVRWLKAMLSALGRPLSAEQHRLFIKFDCWHTLYLPLIRRAFPKVPWVFVYRRPLEVLMSQQAQRGAQVIPGALQPALVEWPNDDRPFGMDDYAARVLSKICEAGLAQVDGSNQLLEYRQLPDIVLSGLLPAWGIELNEEEVGSMRAASRLNAKNPALVFEDDTAEKNRSAPESLREIAQACLDPVYEQLENRRQALGFL